MVEQDTSNIWIWVRILDKNKLAYKVINIRGFRFIIRIIVNLITVYSKNEKEISNNLM